MPVMHAIRRTGYRCLALPLAATLRLLPRARRFDAAVWVARRLARVVNAPGLTPAPDHALHLVLETLAPHSTSFEPRLVLRGVEELASASAAGRGVLLVSVHTELGFVLPRVLDDLGYAPVIVAEAARWRLTGTDRAIPTLQPSASLLVRVRRQWQGGRLVCALIDRPAAFKDWTTEIETDRGTIRVANQLLVVASRCSVPVVFMIALLDDAGRICITLRAQCHPPGTHADVVTAEFAAFLRAMLAA